MLLAIAAVIISIWELVDKGKRERVIWMRRGTWWWFYHPSPNYAPFGTIPDIYGLIGGIAQCIFSTIQYVCYLRGVDNPIQLCLLPSIFYLCLAGSKMIGKSKTDWDTNYVLEILDHCEWTWVIWATIDILWEKKKLWLGGGNICIMCSFSVVNFSLY